MEKPSSLVFRLAAGCEQLFSSDSLQSVAEENIAVYWLPNQMSYVDERQIGSLSLRHKEFGFTTVAGHKFRLHLRKVDPKAGPQERSLGVIQAQEQRQEVLVEADGSLSLRMADSAKPLPPNPFSAPAISPTAALTQGTKEQQTIAEQMRARAFRLRRSAVESSAVAAPKSPTSAPLDDEELAGWTTVTTERKDPEAASTRFQQSATDPAVDRTATNDVGDREQEEEQEEEEEEEEEDYGDEDEALARALAMSMAEQKQHIPAAETSDAVAANTADTLRHRAGRGEENERKAQPTNESERMCRICHGSSEDGHLFSPCQCRGSMQFVHVECLNQWRRHSPNAQSYWKCDQCQHEYSLRRTFVAELLMSDRFITWLSVGLCLAFTAFISFLAWVVEQTPLLSQPLAFTVFRTVEWLPWWYRSDAYEWLQSAFARALLDRLVTGITGFGTVGFAWHCWTQYQINRHHEAGWRNLGMMGLWLASLQGDGLARFALIIGCAFGAKTIFLVTQHLAKSLSQRFGEAILDVGLDAQEPRAAAD